MSGDLADYGNKFYRITDNILKLPLQYEVDSTPDYPIDNLHKELWESSIKSNYFLFSNRPI